MARDARLSLARASSGQHESGALPRSGRVRARQLHACAALLARSLSGDDSLNPRPRAYFEKYLVPRFLPVVRMALASHSFRTGNARSFVEIFRALDSCSIDEPGVFLMAASNVLV